MASTNSLILKNQREVINFLLILTVLSSCSPSLKFKRHHIIHDKKMAFHFTSVFKPLKSMWPKNHNKNAGQYKETHSA